jgi:hypothetical protein
LPGGSAVTSFLSGTEMSISFRGMGIPRDGRFVSQHLEGAAPASSSNAHERFPRRTTR